MSLVAAPVFYRAVESWFMLVLVAAMAIIELVAFINCLTQRAEAFPVVGSLTKLQWALILFASLAATVLCFTYFPFFAFVAITAAAVYLLDVRPALRDTSHGSGPWG